MHAEIAEKNLLHPEGMDGPEDWEVQCWSNKCEQPFGSPTDGLVNS